MMPAARRLLLSAALIVSAGAAAAPRGAFAVAVLRRDGVLIPFANFDGKRWRNSWPPPQLELTVPINVDSIPSRWWGATGPLDTWQASIAGASRSLKVVQPDWVGIHCARSIALKTDYRVDGVVPPQNVQPYPKDALAISPPQPVEAIEVLPTTGAEATELAPALLEAFNRMERLTESNYGHPVSKKKRENIQPALDALYAFGTAPRVYYFEALRYYRLLGQSSSGCEAVGVGTGWIARDGAAMKPMLVTVDLLDCDRRGASYMLPLGALHVGSRLFWFAQFSGWDHERYTVIEISPKRVEAVVSTWAGGC